MKRILVIGSSNVDRTLSLDRLPSPGETLSAFSIRKAAGGKGANQAVACLRAGASVSFLTCLGQEEDGDSLEKILVEEGLGKDIVRVSAPTGGATILLDQHGQNEILVFGGANLELDQKKCKECPSLLEADILLLQNEIPQATNDFLLSQFGQKKTIVYNPAPSRKMDASLLPYVDYLIPNEKEAMSLTGKDNVEEAAESLLSLGAKHVLITLGEAGSVLYSPSEKPIHVDAYPMKAIDTVAAGDTYVGYFAAGLSFGMDEEKAMRWASKASSITVTRKGAIPSIPYAKEVVLD